MTLENTPYNRQLQIFLTVILAYIGRSDMDLVLISGNKSKYCRQHFIVCPQGLLNKHSEKLDMYLNCLSKQREMGLDSPYFESRAFVFEDPNELRGEETEKESTSSGFKSIASPSAAQSSSLEIWEGDSAGITSEAMYRESRSPSSGAIRNLWVVFNVLMDFQLNRAAKSEVKSLEGDTKEVSSSKQGLGMSRNYSFGELMLHLPRIASLP